MSKKLTDQASASPSTEEPQNVEVTVCLKLGLTGLNSLPVFSKPLPATLICSEHAALAGSSVTVPLSTQDQVVLEADGVTLEAVIVQRAESNSLLSATDLPLAIGVDAWEVVGADLLCTVQATQADNRMSGTPWPPFDADSLSQLGLLPPST